MDEKKQEEIAYVLNRYESSIKYYWKSSTHNRKAYKSLRSLTIILGATLTLITSISSADFITSNELLKLNLTIASPILAAILTIASGFAQSFHWGATWRDMVLSAEQLEKERDRFKVTQPEDIDLTKEVSILNELVIDETTNFFQRILNSSKISKNSVDRK